MGCIIAKRGTREAPNVCRIVSGKSATTNPRLPSSGSSSRLLVGQQATLADKMAQLGHVKHKSRSPAKTEDPLDPMAAAKNASAPVVPFWAPPPPPPQMLWSRQKKHTKCTAGKTQVTSRRIHRILGVGIGTVHFVFCDFATESKEELEVRRGKFDFGCFVTDSNDYLSKHSSGYRRPYAGSSTQSLCYSAFRNLELKGYPTYYQPSRDIN